MNAPPTSLIFEKGRPRLRSHWKHSQCTGRSQAEDGFQCKHCQAYVCSASFLSGVLNRNHCPYCLWSRHLDLYEAGDRLAACKSLMEPIGLTFKTTRKKYGAGQGELMLIHLCTGCSHISINRIAADDDPATILSIFENSFCLELQTQTQLDDNGIRAFTAAEVDTVRTRLFGHESSLEETFFCNGMST